MSKIEWTGQTWNPLVGCTIHSAGCKGCYAMGEAWRKMHHPNPKIATKFAGTAKKVNGHAVWTGRINFSEEALLAPLRRRVPTTYFVNSLSDLFHQAVTDEQIDRIFAVMALCPQHTFQVLTKRADRMRAWFERYDAAHDHNTADRVADQVAILLGRDGARGADRTDERWAGWPLPNVWLGVSVEDQRAADERIPDLLATPAAVRFLSCEPLIGPLDFEGCFVADPDPRVHINWLEALDWVICGGESGKAARPMHPDWARSLRDQCAAAGVPFFFKQWGEWAPDDGEGGLDKLDKVIRAPARTWANGAWHQLPKLISERSPNGDYDVHRVGKKVAGRLLDGVQHDGMPA